MALNLPALTSSRFQNTVIVLDLMLQLTYPADTVLANHFRVKRQLGQLDRAFIAELSYAILRRKRVLEAYCEDNITARRLVLLALLLLVPYESSEFEDLLERDEAAWLDRAQTINPDKLPSEVRSELPDWIYQRLVAQFGATEALDLAETLIDPAPVDLRINPMKTVRQPIIEELTKQGISAAPCPYSPVGVRLLSRFTIHDHPLFKDGSIEIQDEGSQLIALLLDPKRDDMVADFCAGAGGKALLLGEMMRNTGFVYAFDISEKRLAGLRPRLARSGLTNIKTIVINDEGDLKVRRLSAKFDSVLVDAPCTGIGTLRRKPDLKWRQNEAALAMLGGKQKSILDAASRLVKPGGRLIYATCSLLKEENDDIVDSFLARNADFNELSAQVELSRQNIKINTGQRLRLLPHRDGTDGFFACIMEHVR